MKTLAFNGQTEHAGREESVGNREEFVSVVAASREEGQPQADADLEPSDPLVVFLAHSGKSSLKHPLLYFGIYKKKLLLRCMRSASPGCAAILRGHQRLPLRSL
jgi:hypothetical protein